NRTAPNMRVCFRKGQMSAVAWDFDHVGMIEGEAENGADVELAAIEAGAQDFEPGDEEGVTLFITEASDLDVVSKALPAQGIKVLSAKLGYKAKNPVSMGSLSAEQQEEVQDFLAGLENDDDVQHVYAGLVD
ncbi:MAG: YebC/PmpR family DNA-binding transcriptional regulator, partial [Comamonas sp.]